MLILSSYLIDTSGFSDPNLSSGFFQSFITTVQHNVVVTTVCPQRQSGLSNVMCSVQQVSSDDGQ